MLAGGFMAALALGLSADSITNYSQAISLQLGSDAAANEKAVSALFAGIGDNMAAKFKLDLGQAGISAANGVVTFTTAPTNQAGVALSFVNENGALTNIKPLDITTNTNSNTAIAELDNAINRINEERAGIGAIINRVTYSVDNLANISQNTSESRSRILDTDYAKASSELARTQIISQAATAMLAQANQSPQSVLKLLQG